MTNQTSLSGQDGGGVEGASLLELAARCEAATKPSAEIDALIRCAIYAPRTAYVEKSKINGAWVVYDGVEHRPGRQRLWEGPGRMQPFTASVDAAVTLIPSGLRWSVDTLSGKAEATVARIDDATGYYDGDEGTGHAATAALALCAAALWSRAQATPNIGEHHVAG